MAVENSTDEEVVTVAKAKPEIEISPVGTPATGRQSPTNKDGLIKGQVVEDNDYWAIINKQRAKK